MLLRYRPGVAGETARTVHLVPVPLVSETVTAGVALCGAVLCPDEVETVAPGVGAPCSLCLISQVRVEPARAPATAARDVRIGDCGPREAAVAYQAWGWPVTQYRNEVWLTLEPDTVALLIPSPLAVRVIAVLRQRRCPPPVLAHPDTPEYWIVLAGEPYGAQLAWPSGVHLVSGRLPLPPTTTPRGPITWVRPPYPDALRLCREIDVFSAVRTAQREPPT